MTPQQPDDRPFDFSTRAIREGQAFDPTTGSVIPPVYFTTTFVQDGIGGFRNGYEYARGGNPTRTSLETLLAALEGGRSRLQLRLGTRGRGHAAARHPRAGRPRADGQRRLRRIAPARVAGLHPLGRLAVDRRDERPGCGEGRHPARRHEGGLGRDPVQPADEDHRHRGGGRAGRTPSARSSSWTTPSPRPTCSSRSRSEPTSSCTRRRSTSAVTATSSAARSC